MFALMARGSFFGFDTRCNEDVDVFISLFDSGNVTLCNSCFSILLLIIRSIFNKSNFRCTNSAAFDGLGGGFGATFFKNSFLGPISGGLSTKIKNNQTLTSISFTYVSTSNNDIYHCQLHLN